jgi:hypothetical protein
MEVGRPTVITDEVLRKLEEAFALGCTDLEACFYADISKTAFYEYQKDNPEFADRKEQLKQRPILLARTTVVKEIQEKGELALKFLERKAKAEFSPSADINLGGQPDNPIVTDQTIKLTPDEAYKKLLG